MRVIAAYLLAVLGGNNNPDAAAIKAILSSVGITAEPDRITKVLAELKGKDLDKLIEEGTARLGAAPSFGGGGGGGDDEEPEAAEEKGAAKGGEKGGDKGGDKGGKKGGDKGGEKGKAGGKGKPKEEPKEEPKAEEEEEDTGVGGLFD